MFEIVRVSYLLANSKAVVSDLLPPARGETDLNDALRFVPRQMIVSECLGLLERDDERIALEKRGFEIFRKRDSARCLASALAGP